MLTCVDRLIHGEDIFAAATVKPIVAVTVDCAIVPHYELRTIDSSLGCLTGGGIGRTDLYDGIFFMELSSEPRPLRLGFGESE